MPNHKNKRKLPGHGPIKCRLCFSGQEDVELHKNWRIINDPCAGGSATPEILVLGFSKGAIQAGLYQGSNFDDVLFGGKQMRNNLTKVLRAVNLLAR